MLEQMNPRRIDRFDGGEDIQDSRVVLNVVAVLLQGVSELLDVLDEVFQVSITSSIQAVPRVQQLPQRVARHLRDCPFGHLDGVVGILDIPS